LLEVSTFAKNNRKANHRRLRTLESQTLQVTKRLESKKAKATIPKVTTVPLLSPSQNQNGPMEIDVRTMKTFLRTNIQLHPEMEIDKKPLFKSFLLSCFSIIC
jgi:SPX domain protein involved in polyphosphate accumulation